MTLKLKGRKRGMTQLFDKQGHSVPCTVIQFDKNVVTQIKTVESDGYKAVQLGCEKVVANDPRKQEQRTRKPQRGHFAKANVEPVKHLFEARVDDTEKFELGQEFDVAIFNEIKFVDVTGVSKGKGFQGTMKLYNFSGGPASHGSGFHRHAGSTGMRSTPGRCPPGGRRPSQMGNRQVCVQNIEIVEVLSDSNILIVKGAIPGPTDSIVTVSAAVKKTK